MPTSPLRGNGCLRNPDRSQLCDDLDLLLVLGGKPTSDSGRTIIGDHEDTCTWCNRPGRHRSLIDVMVNRSPEDTAKLEAILGPIDWADSMD